MEEFHLCGLGNALVDILARTDRRGVRPARVRAGHHAAGRAAPSRRRCSTRSATTSRGWSAAGRWPTRSSPARSSAARRRSSAASATTATACTTPTSSSELGIDFGNPAARRRDRPAPASASSRPTPSGPCGRAWPCRATWRARHVDAERIAASEWLFVEGYVFANPQHRPGRRSARRSGWRRRTA